MHHRGNPLAIRRWFRFILVLVLVALVPNPRYGLNPWWKPYSDRFIERNIEFPSALGPGEAARQVAELRTRLGHPPQAVALSLDTGETRVEVPDPNLPEATNLWSVWHLRLLRRYDWFGVSGPDAVRSQTLPSVRRRVFELDRVDFGLVPAIARAAIERAALQESANVTRMVLSNESRASPTGTGPLRWTVAVESPHEKAEIYADPDGSLIGADLSQTLRARTLDLFQGGQPLHDLVAPIMARFDNTQIDSASVGATAVSVALDSHDVAQEDPLYVSDINGLSRSGLGVNHAFGSPYLPFLPRDVDWDALPRLAKRARELVEPSGAELWSVVIQKRAACLPPPAFEWTFTFKNSDPHLDRIVLDGAGNAVAC